MNPEKIVINGKEFIFHDDPLWESLALELNESPQLITRIISARHSGKQHFRDEVDKMTWEPFNDERQNFNNRAAQTTTQEIYIPTAIALSERYSKQVLLLLREI